jgi:hypothetical protein
MRSLYSAAKSIPFVNRLYNAVFLEGKSRINVVTSFPEFAPASRGSYKMLAPLTVQTIQHFSTSLLGLANKAQDLPEEIGVDAFAERIGHGNLGDLSSLLTKHGSDKSLNRYDVAYASLLGEPSSVTKVMEIGLGTNNRDVVSHMGVHGRPGASLRAFRDFLPNAMVWGADIDVRVLFEDERIRTVHIDQTQPASFEAVADTLGEGFDLMIDDGLHSLDANFHSLAFFLDRLKPNGYAVVEDIPLLNKRFWQLTALILGPRFESYLVRCQTSYIFVCRRASS